MIVTGVVIAAAAAAGVFAVYQFTEAERARELDRWRTRLDIIADSRRADIEKWIAAQFATLDELAENDSLRLYLSLLDDSAGAIGAGAGTAAAGEQPEATYLRNLLTVAAERAGFRPAVAPARVRANVARAGIAGIALLDRDGAPLVASPSMPRLDGALRAFAAGAERGARAMSGIHAGADGAPALAFLAPVFAVQADQSAANQIGAVLGVRQADPDLYRLLKQPGNVDASAEALLVQKDGQSVVYLSPRADGAPPLRRRLPLDTPELAAAHALRAPDGFARATDYRGVEVLVTARAIQGAPWTLLYKVDAAEALAESESRLRQLAIAFLLVIGLATIGMAALWYYGASRRAAHAAARFRRLAERFHEQRDFMHLVTDSQPNAIVVFDGEGRYRWFNGVAVAMSGLDRDALRGKPVASVLGPVAGRRILGWIGECLEKAAPVSHTHSLEVADTKGSVGGSVGGDAGGAIEERIFRVDLIPLPAKKGQTAGGKTAGGKTAGGEAPGVLTISRDITESVRERGRRERILRQLVGALVGVVDRRDPYSADHSLRVAAVARAIAGEMGLEGADAKDADGADIAETAEIAGNLMNLGKIAVPESILTKTESLSDSEIRQVRDSILASAEMIADIEFDGPVAETIRQLQERYDGSGEPKGLQGEDILSSARIVAVANAFVAMVSPRAYRRGMDFDRAIAVLLAESGRAFDRRVVSALVNYVENRGGREQWKRFGVSASDAA